MEKTLGHEAHEVRRLSAVSETYPFVSFVCFVPTYYGTYAIASISTRSPGPGSAAA